MLNEIISAITNVLSNEFKDKKIYIGYLEEGFHRPSFLITYKQSITNDLSHWTYDDNILIQVVYLASLDKNNNPNAEEQYKAIDSMKKIFSRGYIKVLDRAVKIKSITARIQDSTLVRTIGNTNCNDIVLTLSLDVAESIEYTLDNDEKASKIELNLRGGIK